MGRRRASSSADSFSPREQLELYIERVKELEDTRMLRNGFDTSLSMKWDRIQGIRFESNEPDNDDLRSFLVTFRQFIMHEEPIYLDKIYNICHQYITSNILKGYLTESREIWKKQLSHGRLGLVINEKYISPEYVTNLWINGYYFHNDPIKLRKLKSLLPDENLLIKHAFLSHLSQATHQVLYVCFIIEVAMRESQLLL